MRLCQGTIIIVRQGGGLQAQASPLFTQEEVASETQGREQALPSSGARKWRWGLGPGTYWGRWAQAFARVGSGDLGLACPHTHEALAGDGGPALGKSPGRRLTCYAGTPPGRSVQGGGVCRAVGPESLVCTTASEGPAEPLRSHVWAQSAAVTPRTPDIGE